MIRLMVVAFTAAFATACIDFVDPNIPGISDRGSAAVLEARITVTDSGRVNADVKVLPGLDFEGFRRVVLTPRLEAMDRILQPDTVRRDGTLRYVEVWDVDPDIVLGPITLRGPEIDGVVAPPPSIEWFGVRRAGPDSLRLEEGKDLWLGVIAVEGPSTPPPSIRQWFLTLTSGDHSFRLSSDGSPPDSIRVPPNWIPVGDTVHARLIFTQSHVLNESPGDYTGVITADTRLFWFILKDS